MKKMVLIFTVRAFLKAALHMQIHFVIFIYKNKIIKKGFGFTERRNFLAFLQKA